MGEASTKATLQDAVRVHVSEADAALIAEIAREICSALVGGNAAVCITTGTHRRLLERQVSLNGIDVLAALGREQFVSLNAFETLSKIIIGGVPNVIRFEQVIGARVDRAGARYPRVMIFEELVPLMCADSQFASAIELEKLWDTFAEIRPAVSRHREYPAFDLTSVGFNHCKRAENSRDPGLA